MVIEDLLKNVELPAIYKREGKDCYYDTYRKKLIEVTPEETIRQKVAALFEHQYGVPKDMILLEVPMSYYVEGTSGRADIVIHMYDEDEQCLYPVTVIECKNEKVFLTDNVSEQAIRYSDTIGAKYIVVTNGIDLRIAAYDEDTDQYVFLDKILTYGQMIHKEYTLPEYKEEKEIRFTLEELQNQELIWDYNDSGNWIFGEDTPGALRSLAVNLYQALLDTGHKLLPMVKRKNFELLEDLGQRYMDYGNAGGGHYNGVYRAFLVNDRFGETQIVSLSIFGTDAGFRGEKRGSYTSMTVAIDRFKTSHNSLQYNVDRFVKLLPDGKAVFLHNGQISSMKSDEIVAMVSQHGDGIRVGSAGIELGTIDINKLLYLDDKDVSELIYSFIEYALLREEVRRRKKKEK
ncbi:MAG: type I restriction enzyme HsdR N-terminal domain-containing protein [Lachnospiraceae bacterium]